MAADTHRKVTQENILTKPDAVPDCTSQNEVQPDKTTKLQTSSRLHTVINYKQFLEEYTDAPPSPPRKKCEVDLKRKPSKQRIATDKFKSKFATKPMHLPRPVRNKNTQRNVKPAPDRAAEMQPSTSDAPASTLVSDMVLTPAMSNKTRDAIEALLMLGDLPTGGNNPLHVDDSILLVPITGATVPTENQDILQPVNDVENLPTDQGLEIPADMPGNPLPGMLLGIAIKTDGENNDNTQNVKPVKKELSFKQYCIKRKYKLDHKFRCKLCPAELSSVQEFNKHHFNNHPPLPCPDCTLVFISPQTLAKHWYTHAYYMYECQDCGRGFIFKSHLDSHCKVHLKMAGFVCFKPKCGKCFKRELELNAHLITHDKKDIKCEHCDYSNPDIRNVCAHSRVHRDKLPYHCPLCQKGFKSNNRIAGI